MWRMALTAILCLTFSGGCDRSPELKFTHSEQFLKLPAEVQMKLDTALVGEFGTPQSPKLAGNKTVTTAHLLAGQTVYQLRCVQCHGETGDGNGPVAEFLYPRPRDYRKGIFKFASTKFGNRPLREDLIRTVRRGVPGTSMPSFNILDSAEIEAVVDYVMYLARRGEVETRFCIDFEDATADKITDESVKEVLTDIGDRWNVPEEEKIKLASEQPVFTAEHVRRGKQAFLTKGCSKCHEENGRGQSKEPLANDQWGFPTAAADLTSGMLHGGNRPLDVYRRIHGGINGTPMPSFSTLALEDKEMFWDLVAYVLYVSNERRRGHVPDAGLMIPLPSARQPAPSQNAASSK